MPARRWPACEWPGILPACSVRAPTPSNRGRINGLDPLRQEEGHARWTLDQVRVLRRHAVPQGVRTEAPGVRLVRLPLHAACARAHRADRRSWHLRGDVEGLASTGRARLPRSRALWREARRDEAE